MSEIKEQIVERLRAALVEDPNYGPCLRMSLDYEDVKEAADRIEALEHEVQSAGALRLRMDAHRLGHEAARQNFLTMQGTAAKLAARIKVLEEALRPFAEDVSMCAVNSDYNRARLALNATPQDGKGGEE